MVKLDIQNLIKQKFNENVLKITDRSKGYDQIVKIIETHSNRYILKIPRDQIESRILREKTAVKLCKKLNIPAPEILFSNNQLLVETYIKGYDLDEVILSKSDHLPLFFKLGKILKKMHSISGEQFGHVIASPLKGEYVSQREYAQPDIISNFEFLKKTKYFNNTIIKSLSSYLESNFSLLDTDKSVMLHSDYSDSNIRMLENQISGIIDFGDLSVGPPMQDFVYMYMNHYGTPFFDEFLRGYGTHDMEEIQFYTVWWLIWLLSEQIHHKQFDSKFKRREQLLLGIIKRN